jgi:hypothetical protein
VLLGALGACTRPPFKHAPHDTFFQQMPPPRLHAMPRPRRISEWWDRGQQMVQRPLGELFSPGHHLRRLTGGAPALDVNAFGQVPDSSWFENRLGRRPMTIAELLRGPNERAGPAPGLLLVQRGEVEDATPRLVVRDRAGVGWTVKFDPPAFPGMASSAELIASKVLHAVGYHVPENHLVDLRLDRLLLAPRATTPDEYRRPVLLTQERLDQLLAQLNPDPRGGVRALFSRALPGQPLGPFSYRGVRVDDPNDRIPHERRRSLRGLWVFAALLNQTRTRQSNSHDAFIRPDPSSARGYLRHYLLDFGSALGSGGTRVKMPTSGFVYRLDWGYAALRLVALGFYYPYYLAVRRSPYRAVGVFEADLFDPARWRPTYPNPAFDQATPRDSYWAAAILAHLTPQMLEAIVATARYPEPGAAAWVSGVLRRRRDKLLRHAFGAVLPLDRPRVTGYQVQLADLEVQAGLLPATRLRYAWQLRWQRDAWSQPRLASGESVSPSFDLTALLASRRDPAFRRDPFVTLAVRRRQAGRLGPRIELHLRVLDQGLLPAGLWREVD